MTSLGLSRYALTIGAASALLAGCGGSQPPIGAAGSPGVASGYMRVRFEVAGPLNFGKYKYLIIFNTAGNGLTPQAPRYATNWNAYSFMLETEGKNNRPYATAVALIKNPAAHLPPEQVRISTKPAQFSFTENSNGSRAEFTILFQRSTFSGIPHHARVTTSWRFNAFSYDTSEHLIIDSMGSCVKCFTSPHLVVNEAFDKTIDASKKPIGIDPRAKIVSTEFTNNP